jgi:hypothetical protein
VFRSISSSTLIDATSRSVSEAYVRSLIYGQNLQYIVQNDQILVVRESRFLSKVIGQRNSVIGHIEPNPRSVLQILTSLKCPLKMRLVGKDCNFSANSPTTDLRVSIWARDEDLCALEQYMTACSAPSVDFDQLR